MVRFSTAMRWSVGDDTSRIGAVKDYLKKEKPEHLEVILTGQQPSDELVELADYVSEIRKIKHPFDQGLPARPGIEK